MVHLSTATMTRGQRKKLIFHVRLLDNCVTANPVRGGSRSSILKMTSAGTENKLMIMAGLLSLSDWNILAVPHFATFRLLFFRKIGKKQRAKAIKITTQTDFLPSQPVCHYNPLLQFLAKHFLVFYVKTFVYGRWRRNCCCWQPLSRSPRDWPFFTFLCAFASFLPRLSRLIDLPQVSRRESKSTQGSKGFLCCCVGSEPSFSKWAEARGISSQSERRR